MDRISNLPEEILGQILSSFPTKFAVGTSILSSKWKYLHLKTHCLFMDKRHEAYWYFEKGHEAKEKTFIMYVDRVLLLDKISTIEKVHLNCSLQISQQYAWISAAIRKGVEQLHLYSVPQLNVLPHSLFSCRTIVELKIFGHIEDFRVPESIHLPSLTILYLTGQNFLGRNSIGRFISGCSLLQELYLSYCKWDLDSVWHAHLSCATLIRLSVIACEGRVEVDAPNLSYLLYTCNNDVEVALSLKNSDRLVTASLELGFCVTENFVSVQPALALIEAVHPVKELYLLRGALQYLTDYKDDHIPSYPKLQKLNLDRCSYSCWKYIPFLLANSPQLKTLNFKRLIRDTEREKKWPRNVALDPFSTRVKVIEVRDFRGYTTELALLKYLLVNAQSLEKLILYNDRYTTTKEQESQARMELLKFPRARTCVVQFM